MTQKISLPLWIIIVFLVTLIAGSWLFVIPQIKEAAANEQALLIIDKQNKDSIINNTNLTVDSKKKLIIDTLLPDSDNQLDLSIQVDGLAKQMGIALNSLNTNIGSSSSSQGSTSTKVEGSTSAIPGGLKTVSLSVSFTAGYNQALDFIKGLYTINRLIRVDSVIFNGGTNGLTTQIDAVAFYAPQGSTSTKSGTSTSDSSKTSQ